MAASKGVRAAQLARHPEVLELYASGLRIGQVAERTGLTAAAVHGIVHRAAAKGLVDRRDDRGANNPGPSAEAVAVLVRYRQRGMSLRAIADLTGRSVSGVKQILQKAGEK